MRRQASSRSLIKRCGSHLQEECDRMLPEPFMQHAVRRTPCSRQLLSREPLEMLEKGRVYGTAECVTWV